MATGGLRFKSSAYFDRRAVIDAIGEARAIAMGKAGAYIRTTAQKSMRRRKGASKPGRPPHAHVGTLKKRIEFAYDSGTRSLVVGPTPMGDNPTAPAALEFGGTSAARNPRRTRRRLGSSGEVRIDGRATRHSTTTRDDQHRVVNLAPLRTAAQVDRANQLNEQLYGPDFITSAPIAARPYMGPALTANLATLPATWAGSVH